MESCAFQMRMLCHGLLQMGSRHAPACPQQSVGQHGRRSAPNQHFATTVPMGRRNAGRVSPPGMCRRTAPIRFDHPRGPGDEAGSPSSFAISNAAEAASDRKTGSHRSWILYAQIMTRIALLLDRDLQIGTQCLQIRTYRSRNARCSASDGHRPCVHRTRANSRSHASNARARGVCGACRVLTAPPIKSQSPASTLK